MILDRINEGGTFFMVPILFILMVVLLLIVKSILKRDTISKTIKLLSSISIFVLVWGFLGHFIGLIGAFDAVE